MVKRLGATALKRFKTGRHVSYVEQLSPLTLLIFNLTTESQAFEGKFSIFTLSPLQPSHDSLKVWIFGLLERRRHQDFFFKEKVLALIFI